MALIDTAEIGRKGGKARAKKLSAKQRSESARKAVNARWAAVRASREAELNKAAEGTGTKRRKKAT